MTKTKPTKSDTALARLIQRLRGLAFGQPPDPHVVAIVVATMLDEATEKRLARCITESSRDFLDAGPKRAETIAALMELARELPRPALLFPAEPHPTGSGSPDSTPTP